MTQAVRTGSLVIIVLVGWAVISPAAWGQVRSSADLQVAARFAQAADKTFREGVHATLPPHLSSLLGISSNEKECLVKQTVTRTGKLVQGFDVSLTNKNDIVLFVVDETVNDQALYLTSAKGNLRKVVSVKAGVGEVQRITDTDKKAFEKERQFWLDRLVPDSARSKP